MVAESNRPRGRWDGNTSWVVVGVLGVLMAVAVVLLLVIVRHASGAIMEALAAGLTAPR